MNNNRMLHMRLRPAVCSAAALLLPPSFISSALAAQPFLQIPTEQRSLLEIELPADASTVQLAGICFLPDCNLDNALPAPVCIDCEWCEDNGYYFTCPDGTAPDYSQSCYRNESYTKCTTEQWCRNKGYNKTAQSCYDLGPTWYPKDQCPNGLDLYKSCVEDKERACEDNGYVNNCDRPDKTEICEWDSSYAQCCNDTESNGCPENSKVSGCESGAIVGKDSCGYDCHQCCQTSCPAGYAYTDEETSGGTSGYIKDMANEDDYCLHCTKGKLYKRKENPCTGYDVCSNYGGVDNGDYCYTGSTKKYSKCLTECRPGYIEWCDTPVTDCEKLGYKYDKSVCDGAPAVACPFNKDKWFCECPYTISAETCSSQCKNIGSKSCTRNGVTYYEACGTSKCSSGQTCNNGTCKSNMSGKTYRCCGYSSSCAYSGTSNSYDAYCREKWGMSCYQRCTDYYGYSSCNSIESKCYSSGGSPIFRGCDSSSDLLGAYYANVVWLECN